MTGVRLLTKNAWCGRILSEWAARGARAIRHLHEAALVLGEAVSRHGLRGCRFTRRPRWPTPGRGGGASADVLRLQQCASTPAPRLPAPSVERRRAEAARRAFAALLTAATETGRRCGNLEAVGTNTAAPCAAPGLQDVMLTVWTAKSRHREPPRRGDQEDAISCAGFL